MTRTVQERSGLPGNAENGPPLRATEFSSVGLASNVEDVERFVSFVEMTDRDRVVGIGGPAPWRGC